MMNCTSGPTCASVRSWSLPTVWVWVFTLRVLGRSVVRRLRFGVDHLDLTVRHGARLHQPREERDPEAADGDRRRDVHPVRTGEVGLERRTDLPVEVEVPRDEHDHGDGGEHAGLVLQLALE